MLNEAGVIGDARNSGFQALNIAAQFGSTRIALVGFDMHGAAGVHWHGNHASGLNNPGPANFKRWRHAFEGSARTLIEAGIEVVNASPDSALTVFPRMTLEGAMIRWRL